MESLFRLEILQVRLQEPRLRLTIPGVGNTSGGAARAKEGKDHDWEVTSRCFVVSQKDRTAQLLGSVKVNNSNQHQLKHAAL